MSSRIAAPSRAPLRARAERASVTSLVSSASSSTAATLPTDENRADLVAATLHAFRRERQTLQRDRGARDGYAAERRRKETANRLDILEVERDAVHVFDVIDGQPDTDPDGAVLERFGTGRLPVILVGDLTHALLADVFDRDEPGGAAVLVDDDGNVHLHGLHFTQ